jgi:NAD-reducing hydrogenase small subunit
MDKLRLATAWLDGCSGCHMSLLDTDEGILAVAAKATLVYGPLVDAQDYPEQVDVALVEGAISSQADVRLIETIRKRTKIVVALGDCAVTGNVPSMRNSIPVSRVMKCLYVERAQVANGVHTNDVPALLPQSRPIHEFVRVDYHIPGCPPAAQSILSILSDLLESRKPKATGLKFG